MLQLELRSKLSPEKVVKDLQRFFGEGGLGLELKEATHACLTFEGGGGYVTANLCQDEKQTLIQIVTQEWDYQVKQFASKLK